MAGVLRVKPLFAAAALVGAVTITSPVEAASRGKPATVATFVGTWTGHTRGLVISRHGRGEEGASSGCCDPVIRLAFQLSQPRRTADDARAVATAVSVEVLDRRFFTKAYPPPHVGEVREVRLKSGVITEGLTGGTYCDRVAESKGTCGA
jgi:hypothetical protein